MVPLILICPGIIVASVVVVIVVTFFWHILFFIFPEAASSPVYRAVREHARERIV
jgi:hypothetical protein